MSGIISYNNFAKLTSIRSVELSNNTGVDLDLNLLGLSQNLRSVMVQVCQVFSYIKNEPVPSVPGL